MPLNMGLYTKYNKKKTYTSLAVLVLVFVFLLFCDFSSYAQVNKANPQSNTGKELEELLQKAAANIGISPALAEQLADKAFTLAQEKKEALYTIRALILSGKIKNLKGDHTTALNLYSKAATLAKQQHAVKEEIETFINIGEMVYKKGDYDQSLLLFLKADSLAGSSHLERQQATALYYIGKYNQTKGNFSQARNYYLRSLAINRKNNDSVQLALLLPSLGKYYISEGSLNLALNCYQEAFYISTRLNNQLLSADICNHLGGLYSDLKEFNKAMHYHRQALQYRQAMQYPGELAKSYNNIGRIYFGLGQLDSAEYYFKKSLVLCKSTNYKKGLVKSLVNLGSVYRLGNEPEKASVNLFSALEIATHIGYDNGIADAAIDLGDLFTAGNKLDTAIFYYKLALSKLIKTNYDEDLLRIYLGLYKCYNNKQEYKEALTYHVALLETEKKLLNVENKRQLAILNIMFDTERKEKDYRVLLKDNELKASLLKSKNTFLWLIVVALGFMILLCLYLYNRFYVKKKANKQLEELNAKISSRNAEFEKLNRELEQVSKEKDKLFSIISHELRNPLYWMQNLTEALSQKYKAMAPEKVRKTILSLDESAKNVYHLMDNLLHWSRSKLNRVHPRKGVHNLSALISETTFMYETFLRQKEIVFKKTIPDDVFINADPDLFCCVIRNLISNAIKYTPNGGSIAIGYEQHDEFVTIIISDSGKGIAVSDLKTIFATGNIALSMPGLMQEKGSGLGLKLCKDFVEMNDGKIWVESTEGSGTQFFFNVPICGQNMKSYTKEKIALME